MPLDRGFSNAHNDSRQTVLNSDGKSTIFSFVEYGYELVCIVPFAFWHHQHGLLARTVGVPGSSASFFFSPSHTELPGATRHADNDPRFGIQRGVNGLNTRNHNVPFLFHKWSMPPFAAYYRAHPLAAALRQRWPRLCIVHNKRSNWPEDPKLRSEFRESQLDQLFGALRAHGLHVVYVCSSGDETRAGFTHDMRDSLAAVKGRSCRSNYLMKSYGVVVTRLQTIIAEFGVGWNEGQYATHAAAQWYVSCQGGTAIISSLFGGVNLIYDIWPHSGERSTNEYSRLHNKSFSDVTVRLATSFAQLLQHARALQV